MNPDGTATSRVFKLREKDNGELSVDVSSLTSPEISIGDKSKFLLLQIENKSVIALDLSTYHAPEVDGSNDAHAGYGMSLEDEIIPGLLARASLRIL